MAAARLALGLHNASADWTKSLIDNSAKPSGALIWSGHGRMPPQLLGISGDNTYANYKEANLAVWRMTGLLLWCRRCLRRRTVLNGHGKRPAR